MLDLDSALTALSPLDGRYQPQLIAAAELFSEAALIQYRIKVELRYVLFLSKHNLIPKISTSEQSALLDWSENFDLASAKKIKELEKTTKHDVKAVEYFLRETLEAQKSPLAPFIHLALTSEDTNSMSQAMIWKATTEKVLLPELKAVLKRMTEMITEYAELPMLGRTHGQPAVPTTVGKELSVFAIRLLTELQILENLPIEAKMTGAVGNFNAHQIAFPGQDWQKLSDEFITSLGLTPHLVTTQILPIEGYSRIFASLQRINSIFIDLDQDIWRYISDSYFTQKLEKGQVGSSTMPQKINPIDFENSEGNLGLANALFQHFIQKLPISRLQRDLSDSTVKRSWGSAVGYSVLGYRSLLKGLKKISPNKEKLSQELEEHWEVLAEAMQVVLRTNGDDKGYEKLQKLTQGKHVTKAGLQEFITSLSLDEKTKKRLLTLTPASYIGIANTVTKQTLHQLQTYLQRSP